MNCRTILHTVAPAQAELARILDLTGGTACRCDTHYLIEHAEPMPGGTLAALRQTLPYDINPLPGGFDPAAVRLIVLDMDSTLITIECIDELADLQGIKPEVAAITEAAMRGELDFAGALRKRVELLRGLPEAALRRVYEERVRFNPGAESLIAGARALGIQSAVVSGGFTFFVERVKQSLHLDHARANRLELADGVLTGRVVGEIIGADAKAAFVGELCANAGIAPMQVIAIGDGANDAKMLAAAGLGVAFRAKPALEAVADVVIRHGGLDAIAAFFAPLPVAVGEA